MTTSQELIVALEKATGPDRELDALIYCATNAPPEGADKIWAVGVDVFWAGGTVKQGPLFLKGVNLPAYTSSIDAAMTLVPEGWYCVEILRDNEGEWVPRLHQNKRGLLSAHANHPRLSIALCIAALKARDAK